MISTGRPLIVSVSRTHFELKGGYIDNDFEYVGTAIGGQASSGSLGVFASLSFEVGMSYLPMTTPAFNMNIHYPHHMYTKIGLQRSMDAKGGVNEAARDTIGPPLQTERRQPPHHLRGRLSARLR